MHDQHSSGCTTAARRGDRDPQVAYEEQQALVLDDLLSEHPGLMTYEEARLARVLATHGPDCTVLRFTYWYTGRPPVYEVVVRR